MLRQLWLIATIVNNATIVITSKSSKCILLQVDHFVILRCLLSRALTSVPSEEAYSFFVALLSGNPNQIRRYREYLTLPFNIGELISNSEISNTYVMHTKKNTKQILKICIILSFNSRAQR